MHEAHIETVENLFDCWNITSEFQDMSHRGIIQIIFQGINRRRLVCCLVRRLKSIN